MAYLLDKDSLNGEGGKICKIDNLQVELSEREELKLDELKVPKLKDRENLSFTITIDPKDQPDIEKIFPQTKLIDELWNKLHDEKTSLNTIQQFADKLGTELKITIAPKTKA
jgi:predicted 3-demethylubiquinone-9 3-methyltransferase (glyoxalase superfamily)